MSDAPKKKNILAALESEEGIPVRELRFHRSTGVDVPGKQGATLIRAIAPKSELAADRYEITLLPRMRAFRCVYYPATVSIARPVVTFFVHETWATWEPLEQ